MKQPGEIPRKTPLRRTGWNRTGRAPSRSPHPSPSRQERIAAERAEERHAKDVARARSGGVCEACGSRRATNFSHRIGEAQGGRWRPANGLDMCGSGTTGCHGWCHDHPTEARQRGWMLRRNVDPEASPVLVFGRGWVLLGDDGSVQPTDLRPDAWPSLDIAND